MNTDYIAQRASSGKWVAKYPYGYRLIINNDGNHAVTVVEIEKQMVQRIFELYTSEKYSLSMIVAEIQSIYKQPLYKSKLEHILKQPFYYGVMKIKGKYYPHDYGAFITKEMFDKAQQILSNRRGRWKPVIENKNEM